jgi:signal transduction histidine kinase
MRLPPGFRTTAARLSALYTLLFGVCAIFLIFYMTGLSSRMLASQTRETINEEVVGLADAYRRGGLPLLVRVIERRAGQPSANLYLITDPNGRILSGNVQALEPGVLDTEGWTDQPFTYLRYGDTSQTEGGYSQDARAGNPRRHAAIALVERLPNRMIVLVGRDLGEPERFRVVVRNALVGALGIMAAGGLLIWFFVGRRALKHIDRVSEASRRIMGGDLNGRLPVSGAGDEFDRLSENLNTMLARIAELNEGLRQVSANIAHDLKTPLTRLRNRAEAALGEQDDPQKYREALEQTIAESDQLIRTFNAILMISRLEAGYSAEPAGLVDLSELVRGVVELYEPVAEEMGVALKADIAPAIEVNGNRELIAQAASNIVDNAIKYSADGDTSKVTVSLERKNGKAILRVSDNGPGIPDEHDRRRATERFVRLEQSRSQPGSGLGLSLAKAVMKFHAGRLDLEPLDPGLSVVMSFRDKEPK